MSSKNKTCCHPNWLPHHPMPTVHARFSLLLNWHLDGHQLCPQQYVIPLVFIAQVLHILQFHRPVSSFVNVYAVIIFTVLFINSFVLLVLAIVVIDGVLGVVIVVIFLANILSGVSVFIILFGIILLATAPLLLNLHCGRFGC